MFAIARMACTMAGIHRSDTRPLELRADLLEMLLEEKRSRPVIRLRLAGKVAHDVRLSPFASIVRRTLASLETSECWQQRYLIITDVARQSHGAADIFKGVLGSQKHVLPGG